MSGWVKYQETVPAAASNHGFKIQGTVFSDHIATMEPDTWKWVSQVGPVQSGGDGNHLIYIFDNAVGPIKVDLADMELEHFAEQPEPRAYN